MFKKISAEQIMTIRKAVLFSDMRSIEAQQIVGLLDGLQAINEAKPAQKEDKPVDPRM